MLISLAFLILGAVVLGWLATKCKLPPLVGMLLAGLLLGPYLDPSLTVISTDLRRAALIVILLRAGLSLDLPALRSVGRPALLLCFVPASFEIVGCLVLAPPLLGFTHTEALVLGCVLAAVSPAVVVPRMLKLIETKRGGSIPQMLMTGASVDDVFVITLFTAATGLAAGEAVSVWSLLTIPLSIVAGVGVGLVVGWGVARLPFRLPAPILLAVAVVLTALEGFFPFAALLAVMALGAGVRLSAPGRAAEMSAPLSGIWEAAEPVLFGLVGASLAPQSLLMTGPGAVVLILGALVFRILGVFTCVTKTRLTGRERTFCALAYLPKATVQAAIGGLPLAMGLPCGEVVLATAVLAILLTAPLGALAIDVSQKKLLK